jgi:hypothetical protein
MNGECTLMIQIGAESTEMILSDSFTFNLITNGNGPFSIYPVQQELNGARASRSIDLLFSSGQS